MDRQNSIQLELFNNAGEGGLSNAQTTSNSFLSSIWRYEKTILLLILFVITGIITFSLGVEKGKKMALAVNNQRLNSAIRAVPIQEGSIKQDSAAKAKTSPLPQQLKTIENLGGYTIQLASYSTKKVAEKEAQALKKKGYLPLVLTKGSYTILCVGKFPKKETAKPVLTQFEKRYRGCYLRRL